MLWLDCLSSMTSAGWAVKTLHLQLERNSNFLLLRNCYSFLYSFGSQSTISPYMRSEVGVRWVGSSRLSTVLTSFWRFRLLECLCPLHSPWDVYTKFGIGGMGLATKLCNWIRRSSWECGCSQFEYNWLLFGCLSISDTIDSNESDVNMHPALQSKQIFDEISLCAIQHHLCLHYIW